MTTLIGRLQELDRRVHRALTARRSWAVPALTAVLTVAFALLAARAQTTALRGLFVVAAGWSALLAYLTAGRRLRGD